MKQTFLLWFVVSISAVAQTVEFKLHHGYLVVVKCSVGGLHGLVAIVDTGVTETVVDVSVVKRLGLTTTADTATSGTKDTPVQAVSIPQIDFGPLHAESLAGIAMDLNRLTREMSIRPDVLIGTDLLRRGSFVIDYQAKQIIFGPSLPMAHSAPLLPDKRLLLVEAEIDKKMVRFQVDTGFNAILIYGGRVPVWNRTPISPNPLASNIRLVSFPTLQIGNWRGRQIAAAVTEEQPPGHAAFDGLFGPVSIGVRRVGFNFEKQVMGWE